MNADTPGRLLGYSLPFYADRQVVAGAGAALAFLW